MNMAQAMTSDSIKNIVGKGDNASIFFLFQQCFQCGIHNFFYDSQCFPPFQRQKVSSFKLHSTCCLQMFSSPKFCCMPNYLNATSGGQLKETSRKHG